ncbi:MAG: SDR family NAD(P)-dependent oxidoreductase [Bradymonadaceae bacterium]
MVRSGRAGGTPISFPGNATYAASKAALFALVRASRLELADTDVHFGIVLPGFTRTAMTTGLDSHLPSKSPEAVARAIVRCLEDRRAIVVPGLLNHLAMRIFGALPELAARRNRRRLATGPTRRTRPRRHHRPGRLLRFSQRSGPAVPAPPRGPRLPA